MSVHQLNAWLYQQSICFFISSLKPYVWKKSPLTCYIYVYKYINWCVRALQILFPLHKIFALKPQNEFVYKLHLSQCQTHKFLEYTNKQAYVAHKLCCDALRWIEDDEYEWCPPLDGVSFHISVGWTAMADFILAKM